MRQTNINVTTFINKNAGVQNFEGYKMNHNPLYWFKTMGYFDTFIRQLV